MMNFGQPGRAGVRALAVVATLAFAACQDEDTGLMVDPRAEASASLQGAIVASALDVSLGEQVLIAVAPGQLAGVTFAGLEGELRYDARTLQYRGQVPDNGTMVVVNAAEAGRIRMQALNVAGLAERAAIFAFEVKGAGWENALHFAASHYVTRDGKDHGLRFTRGAVTSADMGTMAAARMMSTEDWATYLGAPSVPARVVSTGGMDNSPTGSTKWGDSNGDNSVNVLDNLYTANVSVGNIAQAECIVAGAALNGDCNAVNVDPANLPGLGGPLDACPPGWNSCTQGGRTINVLDNLAIALESTTPGSQSVAGRAMDFGGAASAADTIDLCVGAVGGKRLYTGTLNLTNQHLYQLRGCRVAIGSEAVAADSGTINIEAGTIVEGSDSSSIEITRNGRIFALGTYVQPVVFTCINDGPTAPLRAPQCWGGVQIVGNAVVNEATAGTNPAAYPRAGGGGNQKALEGFLPADLFYGGSNDADNSGTLRHVVVAYGGRSVAANNELNNLTIGACGSGTTLEWIQTHAGSDDGLEIFGGRCNVKGLYSSMNDDDQYDLSFGYDGAAQFLFLRSGIDNGTGTNTDVGFEWDNTENAATYGNNPQTQPVVWNLTAVAGSAAVAGLDKFANIRRGAGADINNAVIVNYAQVFDIDETQSCNKIGTTLTFHGILLSAAAPVIAGTNCLATVMQGHLAAQAAAVPPAYEAAAYAGQMKDPYSITNPDIRATSASLGTSVTPRTPPNNGFFDTNATYLGAAAPTSLASGGIPFYAGWAIHAQNATTR